MHKFLPLILLLTLATSCSLTSKTKTPDQEIANPTALPSSTVSNPQYENKDSNTVPFVSPTTNPSPDTVNTPTQNQVRTSKVFESYQPLTKYNQMAGGDFASSIMVFTSTPVGSQEVEAVATRIADKINELSKSNLKALIVVEPISASQGKLNFTDIALGKYNTDFGNLFVALKAKGVTDANIGNWIVWPEPNQPDRYWNKPGFDSSMFGEMFNNFASQLKSAFPSAEVTILMDTKSYDPSDYDYANGKAVSWSPYLARVKKNLVTTIGIQGFTWYAKDGSDEMTDPKQYLPSNLLIDAAQQLGIKKVLVNTGQAKAYKSNSGITQIPDVKRRRINNEVAAQILKISNNGLEVTANFFVENKINTGEGIDFSYPPEDSAMFRLMINDLNYAKVRIGMFVPN